jgi:type I restriction enzyme S subunit
MIITYKDLREKASLSSCSYKIILFKNKNIKSIQELLLGKPQNGKEIGSFSYTSKSKFYFIRTKALQSNYFLPILNDIQCAVPILPSAFKDFDLRKGDILISKDANIGESGYLDEDLPNFMISGGLVRLRFPVNIRYYIFAFMKSKLFKSQIDYLTGSKGATIRHAKTSWLDAVIPFPSQQNKDEIIEYVSLLTKAIIRKEREIKKKYEKIMSLIDKELKQNQKPNKFIYKLPLFKDFQETCRLDTGIFCEDYKRKQFTIENYIHGAKNIFDSGFTLKRGQNLAVSIIGRSIYIEEYKPNFYKLIRPVNLTDYGTVEKYEYLGNRKKLQTLNKGDILFSAEGTIGKFYVFFDVDDKTITNYHGIVISRKNHVDDLETIFLGLFLGYLRLIGILDHIAVGGQGGSLAQKYLDQIKIPNFPIEKKEEITRYYYNPVNYEKDKLNLSEFEEEDVRITAEVGIVQLDKQIKIIKQRIDEVLYNIAMDMEVNISFDFL